MLTYGNWIHASSRIRALAYIPKLEETGDWKVYHLPRAPDKKEGTIQGIIFALVKRFYTLKRNFLILFYSWDLIFAQRIFLSGWMLFVIKWRKIPLVYDFDDAIYLGNKYSFMRTSNMVKHAGCTIVSSYELEEFCAKLGKNTVYIPSPIDDDRIKEKAWDPDAASSPITIGWIGSSWTENYLEGVAEALRMAFKENTFRMLLVGASEQFNIADIDIANIPWSYQSEVELLHKMDIGIMPLPDDAWSRGKGGYKLYQYMAVGIPVVASPVGINKDIVEHGKTGFLASSSAEWVKCLALLIKDKELRISMGKAGRKKAEANYSYKVCFMTLKNVLEEAVNKNK